MHCLIASVTDQYISSRVHVSAKLECSEREADKQFSRTASDISGQLNATFISTRHSPLCICTSATSTSMPQLAYTQRHNASVYRIHKGRKAADTCGNSLQHPKPDSIVLDAGCGPGTVTSSLATIIPNGQVIGIDAVETAVKKARVQPNLPSN